LCFLEGIVITSRHSIYLQNSVKTKTTTAGKCINHGGAAAWAGWAMALQNFGVAHPMV